MLLSRDRILVTHVGSLPRPAALAALLADEEAGRPVDRAALAKLKKEAVEAVVARQLETGIDIGNDGEQPRVSYLTYVPQRMSGFGGVSRRPIPRDILDFPELAERVMQATLTRSRAFSAPQALAEIRYGDLAAVDEECSLLEHTLAAQPRRFAETFMTAAAPGVIACTMLNAHYESHERYVFAIAREMKREYDRIYARGFVLQLDCPDLASEHAKLFWGKPLRDFVAAAEIHVAALNAAIADIPRDRVRLHVCWGNYEGPHVHDAPLAEILPVLYQAKVGALSIEFANPRHQHEFAALAARRPPPEMAVIPGVIDTTTNFVEHEEVVANRICAAVEAVGARERVIAGCDCGFSTFAGVENVVPSVVWAKLGALVRGAELASQRLWGRARPSGGGADQAAPVRASGLPAP
jgi:5-methyltetrahydropteroyltriglutamate--homocysteine methyltransferase